jgi:hypothetical protein
MLSNTTFDKTNSVKQSLFTQAMGIGNMRIAPVKIGMQNNKFNSSKPVPFAKKSSMGSSVRGGQRSSIVMSASKNDKLFQINNGGANFNKLGN